MQDAGGRILSCFLFLASCFIFFIPSCAEFSQVFEVKPAPHLALAPGSYYQVRQGDTLEKVAEKYGISVQRLAEINDLIKTDELVIGSQLYIPSQEKTESAFPLEKSVSFETDLFIWPVDGRLTSRFGVRRGRQHDGIDISAPRGTPVRAAAGGRVIYSGRLAGYGRLVVMKHAQNYFTAYAHLSQNRVVKGARVDQGETIGLVGSTGRSTGPHCHFEIRQKTAARNPLFFLRQEGRFAGVRD